MLLQVGVVHETIVSTPLDCNAGRQDRVLVLPKSLR